MKDERMTLVDDLLEGLRAQGDDDVYVHALLARLRSAGPEDVAGIIVEAFKAMALGRKALVDMAAAAPWAAPVLRRELDPGRGPTINVTLTHLAKATRDQGLVDAVNRLLPIPRMRRQWASRPLRGPYQQAADRAQVVDLQLVVAAFEAERNTRRLVAEIDRQQQMAAFVPQIAMSVDSASWQRSAVVGRLPCGTRVSVDAQGIATEVDPPRPDPAEPVPFIIRPTPDEAARFRAVLGFGEPAPAPPDDDGVWLVTPSDLRETSEAKGLGTGERMGWAGYDDE